MAALECLLMAVEQNRHYHKPKETLKELLESADLDRADSRVKRAWGVVD
jgi:hypothetical protein